MNPAPNLYHQHVFEETLPAILRGNREVGQWRRLVCPRRRSARCDDIVQPDLVVILKPQLHIMTLSKSSGYLICLSRFFRRPIPTMTSSSSDESTRMRASANIGSSSRRTSSFAIDPPRRQICRAVLYRHHHDSYSTQRNDRPNQGLVTKNPMSTTAQPALEINTSRQFTNWMLEQKLSLGLTTYQAGKLFLLGMQPNGRLSVFERTFNRCLGLWSNGQTIWMSSLYQMWRFENVFEAGQVVDGYDRLFVPQIGYTTGDLDIHDVAVEDSGRVVFVNTLFGCLATLSETHSFVPLWKPPFISRFAAEDRCHLNGLALENGKAKYVTAVSRSDVADGWRDRRHDGGVVIDVTTNEVIADGLSMPHSPRVYRDKLWLLNSGTGYFGYVDRKSGAFEKVAFCPAISVVWLSTATMRLSGCQSRARTKPFPDSILTRISRSSTRKLDVHTNNRSQYGR